MPRYRIVRMQNERSATKFEFDAADDDEAFRLLQDETELDALLDSSGNSDAIEPDVYDEIRGLDRLEDGAFVMLVDEHGLKSQMPYSFEARDFAAKVATLGEEGAYDGRDRNARRGDRRGPRAVRSRRPHSFHVPATVTLERKPHDLDRRPRSNPHASLARRLQRLPHRRRAWLFPQRHYRQSATACAGKPQNRHYAAAAASAAPRASNRNPAEARPIPAAGRPVPQIPDPAATPR